MQPKFEKKARNSSQFTTSTKLSWGKVSSHSGNLAQDEIVYVKSFELYPLIVAFSHLLLILRHSTGNFVSYFFQTIQVDSQVIVIAFFVEYLSPDAGYSYLDRDHCFSAIGEPKGGLSRRGFCRGFVSPQDVGQFSRPGILRVIQLDFDDLEQCPIRHFRLSILLGMPWG